jgi:hypothetical protein
MNYYIEHDRRNYCMRTMSEDDVRLHYGSNVLSILAQDGSASLSQGIDIYLDTCYPSASKLIIQEGSYEMQSM